MAQTYLALLRGINVGGNNIIKMEALRAEFEKLGFLAVRTYIQSGNVLFESELTNVLKIEKVLEKGLSEAFEYRAKVFVRSKRQLAETVDHFPPLFADSTWKHNVIFLSDEIDSKNILNRFEIKREIEQVIYHQGVLFWSAKLSGLTRSTMIKLSARKEYQEMTIRNLNTTKKLLELMMK